MFKKIFGPRNFTLMPLRSADGETLLKDKQQIVDRWAEHFRELLNQQNPVDPMVLDEFPNRPEIIELDLPPTFSEISSAVRSLKNNKAPGPDGIPAEIIKQGGYLCLRSLHLYIIEVWNRGNVPQQWKDSKIVTIYKNKGDKTVCGNSRGISLLAVAGKVLTKIMLKRLISHIAEESLPESQCGFRKDRGTVDMIFTTRQLQEKCREQNKNLFMAFIDLSKAFDTISRETMWEILRKCGCPPKFIAITRQFHDGMMARVSVGGNESEPFSVSTGVRQGCVLAPVLFNIFLICVTSILRRDIQNRAGVTLDYRLDGSLFNIRRLQASTKVTEEHILELQYADDCALVAHTPDALQAALTAAVTAYNRLGLSVNIQKTEVICQWNNPPPLAEPQFRIRGEILKNVPDFKYLGSFLSTTSNLDIEIQHRIKQAAASFGRLRDRVFQNEDLTLNTKVTVYRAICLSSLLYGCEAWTLYRRHLKLLEALHIKCLQKILGITWRDRIPHIDILQRTNSISVEATIAKHQLRWLGHVIRMPEERLPRKILYGQLHQARRNAGGPKKRLKDHLKNTLKSCGIEPTRLEDLASERDVWRSQCWQGVLALEEKRTQHHHEKRQRRHARMAQPRPPDPMYQCPDCNKRCASRIGLYSHRRTHR